MTGITLVKNYVINFNTTYSLWLNWSPPIFSSENTLISYCVYIEDQHGQLLYNDITEDTSYELYNLTVCNIYTATVIAHSGEYSSSNATIQRENNGSMLTFLYSFKLSVIIENYCIILPDHLVTCNKESGYFDVQFKVMVSNISLSIHNCIYYIYRLQVILIFVIVHYLVLREKQIYN